MEHYKCSSCLATLHWRQPEPDGVSKHRLVDCLLKHFIRHRKYQAPHHWHFWGESTSDQWIPLTKAQLQGIGFHLMTLWWASKITAFGCADSAEILIKKIRKSHDGLTFIIWIVRMLLLGMEKQSLYWNIPQITFVSHSLYSRGLSS